jgi:hypothetical protein
MPTATDLVTDLPADFEVFGQAVATSMADLLGGTSGQILAKNSNTDMDFVWIANDQGDITGITATSPLTGGGTSGAITVGIQASSTTQSGAVQLSDSTSTTSSVLAATPTAVKSAYDLANAAIAKAIMDAKGDLIGATAADTPARLAVGTNGQVLTADSTAATGLAWATPATSTNTGLVCVKAKTSFSAASSVTADGVFTSSYANYVILFSYTGSAGALTNLQLRAGGTTATGSNYSYQGLQINGTSVTATRVSNYSMFDAGSANGSDSSTSIITLFQPQVAAGTNIESSYNYSAGNFATPILQEMKGSHSLTNSYDGFAFTPGSGTITGSYTVYGYGVTV